MNRMWRTMLGRFALGLALAAQLAGCVARPAPRPAPGASQPVSINPNLSTAVAQTAQRVKGAGRAEAVVLGNTAIVAIQLDSPIPGGTNGDFALGNGQRLQGPGGSLNTPSPGKPGSYLHRGGTTPGGVPNSEQALPNRQGGPTAAQGLSNGAPNAVPGSAGGSPFDLLTRVANQIRAKHPEVAEVRFTYLPQEARRLDEIAQALRSGLSPQAYMEDLTRLQGAAIPAGATEFNPSHPIQGRYPLLPPR